MAPATAVSLLLLTALVPTVLGLGSAQVVNRCPYSVYVRNVPAAHGGHEQQKQRLSANENWSQPWTRLTNSKGWSIKLSKTESSVPEDILQYEYTFHDEGTIWFDLSYINGNPFGEDWHITASGAKCDPKKKAYRYSTDDAHGMQACPQDAAITVTLCASNLAPKDNPKPGRVARRPRRGL